MFIFSFIAILSLISEDPLIKQLRNSCRWRIGYSRPQIELESSQQLVPVNFGLVVVHSGSDSFRHILFAGQ